MRECDILCVCVHLDVFVWIALCLRGCCYFTGHCCQQGNFLSTLLCKLQCFDGNVGSLYSNQYKLYEFLVW